MGGVRRRQRVGAYALVLNADEQLLLCRMSSRTRTPGRWTLPGGGLGHGEAPEDAVLRELAEETGLEGVVCRLAGVHSNVYGPVEDSIHGVRLIYLVTTTGVSARPERDDTTDDARWFALDVVDDLELSEHARYGVGLLTGDTTLDLGHSSRRPS